MPEDIEHLKKHKIEPANDGERRFLPVVADAAEPPVEEAFGGDGTAPAEPVDADEVRERVVATLKDIYDPEIPLNIYDLGLIYGVDVDERGQVEIRMTLTAPACPVAGALVEEVAQRTGATDGVSRSHVSLVWDPPWTKDRMSDEALLELGLL
jgi:FeS assembly SUF system protein